MQKAEIISSGQTYMAGMDPYTESLRARNDNLKNTSSAAINAADAFTAKLSGLLKSLEKVKAESKHIYAVDGFIQTMTAYRARLSQMH